MLTIRHIHDGQVTSVGAAELAEAIAREGFVWVDVHSPDPEATRILHDPALGLEPLVIEDMLDDTHLPKAEVVGDQLSLVVHGLKLESAAEEVDTVELDVALRAGLLVTHHPDPLASVDLVGRRLDERGAGLIARPVELLHLLLDAMNDVFVPFLDLLDRRLDVIEEDILSRPTQHTRHDLYALQRDVIQLRRVVVPQAEVIRRLGRDRVGLIDEADRALFRDLYDHLYRMAEMSESYRQLLDSAMQSYRSALDDGLNEMLTTLTIISAVLLPISVIAGIYGTNFEHIPELGWRGSYFVMWGVFAVIVVGMLLWFRSRGWIGREAEREAVARRGALGSVLEVPVLGAVLKLPIHTTRKVARTVVNGPAAVARRVRERA